MKCDELKDYDYDPDFPFQSGGRFYDADEVDAAIAELKAKLYEVEEARIEADAADYYQENRELKRALWMERAERAVAEQTVDEWSRYKEKHPFGSWRDEPFEHWVHVWIYIEKLCRKKAEEYK